MDRIREHTDIRVLLKWGYFLLLANSVLRYTGPSNRNSSRYFWVCWPVLRSRSVFDRLWVVLFSAAPATVPASAPIKSRLSTINFSLQHLTFLIRRNTFFKIILLSVLENEENTYHSEFLRFHLRWSRSQTFTSAPAPAPAKITGSATLLLTL